MSRIDLDLQVLNALVDATTSPQRFENRSHLAVEADINASTLSLICSGKRGVSEQTLIHLAHALGVPTRVLLADGQADLQGRVDLMAAEVVAAGELVNRLSKELRDLRKQVERTTTE